MTHARYTFCTACSGWCDTCTVTLSANEATTSEQLGLGCWSVSVVYRTGLRILFFSSVTSVTPVTLGVGLRAGLGRRPTWAGSGRRPGFFWFTSWSATAEGHAPSWSPRFTTCELVSSDRERELGRTWFRDELVWAEFRELDQVENTSWSGKNVGLD